MNAHKIGTVRKIEARLRAYDAAIKAGASKEDAMKQALAVTRKQSEKWRPAVSLNPPTAAEMYAMSTPADGVELDWAGAIRREAEAHAAFFGHPGDEARIADRMAVSRANLACNYFTYLEPFLSE